MQRVENFKVKVVKSLVKGSNDDTKLEKVSIKQYVMT